MMKYVYLTTGTADFLQKIAEKFKKENITLFFGSDHALLFHETNGKTVFQMPRKYEILESTGSVPVKGYALFHYIPVRDEDSPVFEHELSKRPRRLDNADDFLAARILRPMKNHTYLIITFWKSKEAFKAWKDMEEFAFPDEKDRSIEVNKIKMYAGPSYLNEYYIGLNEIDE